MWEHFVTNNNPIALDPDRQEFCYELGEGGPRCAIGIFLDEDTLANLRVGTRMCTKLTSDVVSLFREFNPGAYGLGGVSLEFLEELQSAHDTATATRTIEEKLRNVALLYNLTVP